MADSNRPRRETTLVVRHSEKQKLLLRALLAYEAEDAIESEAKEVIIERIEELLRRRVRTYALTKKLLRGGPMRDNWKGRKKK